MAENLRRSSYDHAPHGNLQQRDGSQHRSDPISAVKGLSTNLLMTCSFAVRQRAEGRLLHTELGIQQPRYSWRTWSKIIDNDIQNDAHTWRDGANKMSRLPTDEELYESEYRKEATIANARRKHCRFTLHNGSGLDD